MCVGAVASLRRTCSAAVLQRRVAIIGRWSGRLAGQTSECRDIRWRCSHCPCPRYRRQCQDVRGGRCGQNLLLEKRQHLLPQYREEILLSKPRPLRVLTLQMLTGLACLQMENSVSVFSTSRPATFASPPHDDTSNEGDVFYGEAYV